MTKDFTVKRTYSHSDDDDGDVRMEFHIGRGSRLYRHWDEDDDFYDEPYEDDARGFIFDMLRTAMAEHRRAIRQEEDKNEKDGISSENSSNTNG